MSKNRLVLSALFLSLTCGLSQSHAAATADLEVSISGARSEQGSILVSVFDDKDQKAYPEEVEKAVIKMKLTVQESANFVIENLPVGDYAIAVLHDENDNGVMDKSGGPIKIPKEGFAFSNDAMGTFGPPSFKKAKISVAAPATKTSMTMKHMKGLSVR